MLFRISILFTLFAAVACKNNEQQFTEQEKALIADTIRQTLNNYYADIRKEGLLAEFRYLDSSSEFFWVPPGFENALNYDSIHSILIKNASSLSSIVNSWENLAIHPLSRELVNYTGKIRSTVTDTAGNVFNSTLLETGIMIRRKNGWKLLSGQTAVIK